MPKSKRPRRRSSSSSGRFSWSSESSLEELSETLKRKDTATGRNRTAGDNRAQWHSTEDSNSNHENPGPSSCSAGRSTSFRESFTERVADRHEDAGTNHGSVSWARERCLRIAADRTCVKDPFGKDSDLVPAVLNFVTNDAEDLDLAEAALLLNGASVVFQKQLKLFKSINEDFEQYIVDLNVTDEPGDDDTGSHPPLNSQSGSERSRKSRPSRSHGKNNLDTPAAYGYPQIGECFVRLKRISIPHYHQNINPLVQVKEEPSGADPEGGISDCTNSVPAFDSDFSDLNSEGCDIATQTPVNNTEDIGISMHEFGSQISGISSVNAPDDSLVEPSTPNLSQGNTFTQFEEHDTSHQGDLTVTDVTLGNTQSNSNQTEANIFEETGSRPGEVASFTPTQTPRRYTYAFNRKTPAKVMPNLVRYDIVDSEVKEGEQQEEMPELSTAFGPRKKCARNLLTEMEASEPESESIWTQCQTRSSGGAQGLNENEMMLASELHTQGEIEDIGPLSVNIEIETQSEPVQAPVVNDGEVPCCSKSLLPMIHSRSDSFEANQSSANRFADENIPNIDRLDDDVIIIEEETCTKFSENELTRFSMAINKIESLFYYITFETTDIQRITSGCQKIGHMLIQLKDYFGARYPGYRWKSFLPENGSLDTVFTNPDSILRRLLRDKREAVDVLILTLSCHVASQIRRTYLRKVAQCAPNTSIFDGETEVTTEHSKKLREEKLKECSTVIINYYRQIPLTYALKTELTVSHTIRLLQMTKRNMTEVDPEKYENRLLEFLHLQRSRKIKDFIVLLNPQKSREVAGYVVALSSLLADGMIEMAVKDKPAYTEEDVVELRQLQSNRSKFRKAVVDLNPPSRPS